MSRHTRIVAAALVLWVLAGVALPAQEDADLPSGSGGGADVPAFSEEDIFQSGAFDQAVEQSKQEEQENRLEYLFGGVFLGSGSLATTAALEGYTASGSFSGKAFVRVSVPNSGSLYLGYNFRHTLVQGQDGTVAFLLAAEDLFANTFTLSEFYLSFDLAKLLFFRAGNQLVAWGPALIWTPVDFINRERIDPQATVDLRVGKPGLRLHLPLKISNLFLFTDFSETVVEIPPTGSGSYEVQDLFEKTNFGLRWDLTVLGFEFGLTGYLGASIQNRYGFDLSGRVLGTDVYGELAMAFPYGSYEFSYAAAAGFQRTLGELRNWSLQGEFFYNSAGEEEGGYSSPIEFLAGGYVPFYVGRIYAHAGITKEDLIGTFLDATLSGFMNISDLSYTVSLKGAFDIAGFIPFSLSMAYNGGGEGKEFTVFTGDNALSLTAQVNLEF